MTGASSICLFMAAMEETTPFLLDVMLPSSIEKPNLLSPVDRVVRIFGQFLHCVGIGCLLWFWMVPISWKTVQLSLEDWYLFPPLLAGLPVTVFLHQLGQNRHLGNVLFIVGLSMALFSIIMDGPLCLLLGTAFLDTFTASNGVFLACDFCFLGLYVRLLDARSSDKIMAPRSRKKIV
jgi:hypothetical protein